MPRRSDRFRVETPDSRARRVRREEALLWRRAMRDAERLRPEGELPRPETPEGPRRAVARRAKPAPAAAEEAPPRAPELPELAPGVVAGVDKRTAERLRRGRLPVEGRIDLHGMTQADAHRALDAFLFDAWNAGRRCVLVITGKGTRSEAGGVLRESVPRWLNLPPSRARVVAFTPAQPRHGGEGALYVLLRRRRER